MSRIIRQLSLFFARALFVGALAATAQAKDKVKVGFIGPLTGGVSVNGIGGRNSAELAVKLRNAHAKAKYEYELVVLDDECKPNVAVQVATKMAADKEIVAAATHYCSATAIATNRHLSQIRLSHHRVGRSAVTSPTEQVCGGASRQRYHDRPERRQCRTHLQTRFQECRGDPRHDGLRQRSQCVFQQISRQAGWQIVGTFGVTADQQDFTAELTQIKSLNPEVVYFGGLTPIGVRIRSQMDKLGIKAVFDGTSGIVSEAFIQGLGPLAEGALAFREGASTEKLPGGKFFLEKYAAQKYDNPPEAYGAFSYAAMDLILDSIEKVGPDRKKVIEELASVKDRDSIIGKITFDDHGQNTVALITKYVVQDGKFVEWDDSEYATGKRKLPGQK